MTRRLASALFLIVVVGVVIAGIVGAASGRGLDSDTSSLEQGRWSFQGTTIERGDGATAAVVPIRGEIRSGGSDPAGGIVGSEDTVALIDAIVESDDFDALLLELDTPGGGVLASVEIADAVRRARSKGLKVVAWMRGAAASGGYYVSAPADSIVAAPDTITGSIGVIMQYFTVEELAGKVGVKPVTIKSGRLKDLRSPFRDTTPEERAVLQGIIDEAYGNFVEAVAKGRDMPKDTVRDLADGRVYTGAQAAENGLVDELGLRAQAYERVAELTGTKVEDLELVEYRRSYSFAELLTSQADAAISAAGLARAGGELLSGLAGGGVTGADIATVARPGGGLYLEYRAAL